MSVFNWGDGQKADEEVMLRIFLHFISFQFQGFTDDRMLHVHVTPFSQECLKRNESLGRGHSGLAEAVRAECCGTGSPLSHSGSDLEALPS